MDYHHWYVGMKVVCISGPLIQNRTKITQPIIGSIYTIREIFPCSPQKVDLCPISIRLIEIINTPRQYLEGFSECKFFACRFRPLHNTDISIFNSLLNPTPKQIEKYKKELKHA